MPTVKPSCKNAIFAVAITAILPSTALGVGETANDSFNSTISVVEPLQIVCAGGDLNFGAIIDPPSGSESIIVKTDGTHDLAMTATPVASVAPAAAGCQIYGGSGDVIHLDIAVNDATNLDVTNTTFKYDTGSEVSCGAEDCSAQAITLGSGFKDLKIGGTMSVNSAINPGTYNTTGAPDYDLTITVQ